MEKVTVVGGGAWGTALAILSNRAGRHVSLCTRNQDVIDSILKKNVNERYLPKIFLDPDIRPTPDIKAACQTDVVILATPSQVVRNAAITLSDYLDPSIPIVIASKGIERGSLCLMSEVLASVLPSNPVAVLSGPNFATEAAAGMPTATTIACRDKPLGEKLLLTLGSTLFRPYLSADVMGTQVGGAVKNVIAIACGIALGRRLGENSRAALITRGIAEIGRLCKAKGGKPETLMGLSGIGDLILTCTSLQSRNMSFGYQLGQGESLEEVQARQRGITEGLTTAESVVELARKLKVEMPICTAVYNVLHQNAGIDETIKDLLERPFKKENEINA